MNRIFPAPGGMGIPGIIGKEAEAATTEYKNGISGKTRRILIVPEIAHRRARTGTGDKMSETRMEIPGWNAEAPSDIILTIFIIQIIPGKIVEE
ncbi:MAG: hypothetical protein NPIRA06_08700 [Nitrospirales bacterium]|nr:MAG: hypothetical protein NPIRA06_08700 [Nitrospirales bacterium]